MFQKGTIFLGTLLTNRSLFRGFFLQKRPYLAAHPCMAFNGSAPPPPRSMQRSNHLSINHLALTESLNNKFLTDVIGTMKLKSEIK